MSKFLFKHLELSVCRHGLMVWPKLDDTIGRSLSLYGEFAESENILMGRYLKDGDLVIDVGANLGTTVLPLSHKVGGRGQLLAYEPQPLMTQCLQTTLTINEIFNVNVVSGAVGMRTGWTRVQAKGICDTGNFGGVSVGECGNKVPMFRLDDLEVDRCTLIKIDVEGLEWDVLQGGEGILLKYKPVIYFEAFPNHGTMSCLDWLMGNGWMCYWHFAFFYSSDNFLKNETNVFGQLGDLNVLAVPENVDQPPDLPLIRSPNEDWRMALAGFR